MVALKFKWLAYLNKDTIFDAGSYKFWAVLILRLL